MSHAGATMRSRRPTLTEIEEVFDAISHETRRHIIMLLAHHGPELPSGYLASRLTHSWPTTTRHLHVLEAARVVSVRREGRNSIYTLKREHLQRVIGGWLELLAPLPRGENWRSPNTRYANRGVQA